MQQLFHWESSDKCHTGKLIIQILNSEILCAKISDCVHGIIYPGTESRERLIVLLDNVEEGLIGSETKASSACDEPLESPTSC